MSDWSLAVHGGAKDIPPDEAASHRAGCLAALDAGRAVLARGGNAVDAVVAAITVLEDNPTFNAGFGSVPTSEGTFELDAALMDGATLDIGAVAALTGIRNPIEVAHKLLRGDRVLLVGDGAFRWAVAQGAIQCSPAEMAHATRSKQGCDTVGCVARDRNGHVAAGTSTGGLQGQPPGRVGDSPLAGCGFYADDSLGAVAFSGEGERIIRQMLAARVTLAMEHRSPEASLREMLPRIVALGGDAGGIAIDRHGRVGWAHNSADFAVAWQDGPDAEPRVALRQNEAALV
jgi:L-asparaginase / beta-aspartyl-peptidase